LTLRIEPPRFRVRPATAAKRRISATAEATSLVARA
jgi:hypothetical protein